MEVTPTTQTTVTQVSSFDPVGLLTTLFGVVVFLLILLGVGYMFWPYIKGWIKYRDRDKESLKYVLLQVTVPRANEIKIDAAEQLFSALYAIKKRWGRAIGFV